MSEDVFMNITGKTQGPFTAPFSDPAFPGAMHLLSISFGFSAPHVSGVTTPPRVGAKTIIISHIVDLASEQLLRALLTGELLTTVQFFFRESEGSLVAPAYMTLTLNNGFITDIAMASSSENTHENISFSAFEQCHVDIKTIDMATGALEAEKQVGFDLVNNVLL